MTGVGRVQALGQLALALMNLQGALHFSEISQLPCFRKATEGVPGWALWELLPQPLLLQKLPQFHAQREKKEEMFPF